MKYILFLYLCGINCILKNHGFTNEIKSYCRLKSSKCSFRITVNRHHTMMWFVNNYVFLVFPKCLFLINLEILKRKLIVYQLKFLVCKG